MLLDLEKEVVHVVANADDVAVSVKGKFLNTPYTNNSKWHKSMGLIMPTILKYEQNIASIVH